MRAVRLLPAACAIAVLAGLAGAGGCGDNSVFPRASNTPTNTATPTATPTLGAGAFLYSGNHAAGTISEYKRSQTSGALSSIGTVSGGAVNGPVGITTDPAGKFLYLANPSAGLYQFRINLSSGVLTPLTANNGLVKAGDEPQWVAFSRSGTNSFAYATNLGAGSIAGSISQYVLQTNGELKSNGTAISGLLSHPFGAVATSSYLYVADNANGTVVSFPINSNGTLATGSASATASSSQNVRNPVVVIVDPTSSFVYVSDQTTGYVSVFSTSGGALSSLIQSVPSTTLGGAVGLALASISSSTEFLYAANQVANSISLYIVDTSSGELAPAGVVFTSLAGPTGLAVGTSSSGTSYLYAADQNGNDIVQFTVNSINGSLSNPVTIASGSDPQFLAIPAQ